MQIPAHIRTQALPAALETAVVLTPVLRRYPRASKAVSFILTAQAAAKAVQSFRAKMARPEPERESWSVTVKGDDDLYEHALSILASQSSSNWQALEAELDWIYEEDEDGDPVSTGERSEIKAKPAERAERNFTLGGHPVCGYVETFAARRSATVPGTQMSSAQGVAQSYRTPEVFFVAESEAGQKAVLSALQDQAANAKRDRRTRTPILYTTSSGSYRAGWDRAGEVPARPVDSVAVTNGQVQDVVDDILAFRALESEYVRRGVPFHRGFLLYGPPGTGKTSAVKAIAHAVGSDLYAANLGTLNDATLAELIKGVSRAKKGAILLLEDIDSFGAARQRDEDDEGDETGRNAGISTTGLLNALDGVETPHGLITILTTNHPEFLDDALVRPGRVDKKVHFTYPDNATVERHFAYFFGRKPSAPLYAAGRSGAELNEVFVAHMTDPTGAERVLSRPVSAVA